MSSQQRRSTSHGKAGTHIAGRRRSQGRGAEHDGARGVLANEVVVVRDSQQALDYLCCRGIFEKRIKENPAVILLDLKLRYGPSRHIASRHQPGRSGSWHAASFAEHDVRDPEQKSAVVGFGRNGIQVITGRPWRSTTDKRRFAWGNCRPSPGAGHGVLRAAPAGARAQGPFRPLAPKAPSGNGGQTGEFSKTRLLIARRICAARHKFALPSGRRLCSLWLRDLSMVDSRGSAAPA
jgi:hypothetical protein